jgi:hypothetical protein
MPITSASGLASRYIKASASSTPVSTSRKTGEGGEGFVEFTR